MSQPPFSQYNPDEEATLKYSFLVQPKASGSGSLKDVDFEFDGEQSVETGLYSKHLNTKTIGEATFEDIDW